MPIRPELRPLYPPHWRELSSHVRYGATVLYDDPSNRLPLLRENDNEKTSW